MILKEIYLYPDLFEYSDDMIGSFRDQSRSICNFIERTIKKEKISTDGFNKICFIGKKEIIKNTYINSSGALVVEFKLKEKEYFSKRSENQLNQYFSVLLENALLAEDVFFLKKEIILNAINKFREIGFVNKWKWKSKTIKNYGIKCDLYCQLTTSKFSLILFIYKNKNIIFEKIVLETEPDELIFNPLLNDVVIENGKLVILDKFGEITSNVKLNEFLIDNT